MSDTLSLIFASMRDILFSQRAPETRLKVPLGVPAGYDSSTSCTKDDTASGNAGARSAAEGQHDDDQSK
ncbi:uncharacterized protein RHO25_002203 [Cercospora beticola]|uniref:Uncharacterized protein n=1 Tax=Cercospora beticola TaxID=122368 RepID=A0ABZ0NDI4_CERBT|nr:hypothetical protein RHO25_002203 [Cercospora beticola]